MPLWRALVLAAWCPHVGGIWCGRLWADGSTPVQLAEHNSKITLTAMTHAMDGRAEVADLMGDLLQQMQHAHGKIL